MRGEHRFQWLGVPEFQGIDLFLQAVFEDGEKLCLQFCEAHGICPLGNGVQFFGREVCQCMGTAGEHSDADLVGDHLHHADGSLK